MKKLFQMDPPYWTEVGCDVNAINKLISQGVDLTQRGSLENGTVLHYWANGPYNTAADDGSIHQGDSLDVVKLLIEKGADLLAINSWGFTPLLEAANGRNDDRPNLKVLDFLLEREEYSRAEKIEAMELAGAVILQNEKNASLFNKAFDYWRKSLHLRRQMEVDDLGFIAKPQLTLKNVQTTEWNTSAELEDIIEHPDTYVIQSFLVRLRIFSSKSWDALKSLMLWFTFLDDFFIMQLQHQRSFVEIFDIIWVMLETLVNRSDLRENSDAQWGRVEIVRKLMKVFKFLDKESPNFWTEEIITTSLDLMASATKFRGCVFFYMLKFVRMLSHLPQFLLNKETMKILSDARCYRLGGNLLHAALDYVSLPDANLFGTVRLLLNAGCDPNANLVDLGPEKAPPKL